MAEIPKDVKRLLFGMDGGNPQGRKEVAIWNGR